MNLSKILLIKKDLASNFNKVKITTASYIVQGIKEMQYAIWPCMTVSQEDPHASILSKQLI